MTQGNIIENARKSFARYLRENVGDEVADDRDDAILSGREDSAEFIAGFQAALPMVLEMVAEIAEERVLGYAFGRIKLQTPTPGKAAHDEAAYIASAIRALANDDNAS